MKGLFVAAITGVFTVVVAVSVVYGWGANANCWEANGSQHASASANSNGLRDGKLKVLARVDFNQDDDESEFANEAISLSAYATSDPDDPALAQSDVHGFDANNAFQATSDSDND
jgi:hypothetical protein